MSTTALCVFDLDNQYVTTGGANQHSDKNIGIVTVSVEETTVSNSLFEGYDEAGYHNPPFSDEIEQSVAYENNIISDIPGGITFAAIDEVSVTGNTFTNANGIRLEPHWNDTKDKCTSIEINGNKFISMHEGEDQFAVRTKDKDDNPGCTVDGLDITDNYWGAEEPIFEDLIDTTTPEKLQELIPENFDDYFIDENLTERPNLETPDEPGGDEGGDEGDDEGGDEPDTPPTPTRPSGSSGSGSNLYPLPTVGEPTTPSEPSTPSTPSGFVSDTTNDLTVDGVYQFRITSLDGTVPFLTVSNAHFRVEFVSQEGSDYFFKIYAQGAAGSTTEISVNGTALLTATVGGSAQVDGVISDTTAPFTVVKGGTYQFRLTASERPSFAAGSASFTVEYAGQIGSDYFYKVHAVGEPGDGCGFYINGASTPVAVAHIA